MWNMFHNRWDVPDKAWSIEGQLNRDMWTFSQQEPVEFFDDLVNVHKILETWVWTTGPTREDLVLWRRINEDIWEFKQDCGVTVLTSWLDVSVCVCVCNYWFVVYCQPVHLLPDSFKGHRSKGVATSSLWNQTHLFPCRLFTSCPNTAWGDTWMTKYKIWAVSSDLQAKTGLILRESTELVLVTANQKK